jgi:hypothetical protein
MRRDIDRGIDPIQPSSPPRLDDHALHRTPGQRPAAGAQLHEQRIVRHA